MASELDREELAMLNLCRLYSEDSPTGMSLSGPRIYPKMREVARGLLNRGLLQGRISDLRLTDAGRAVLTSAGSHAE